MLKRHPKIAAWAETLVTAAAVALLYYVLKLPTHGLDLEFYDDAEALYHTLIVRSGKLLYRDTYSHHFLGYVLQYLLVAKFIGFGVELSRCTAFVNQTAMGVVLFLCARRLMSFRMALLAACLAVSAREPWVVAFYIQYQLSLGIVLALYGALRFLEHERPGWLAFSGFWCGLLFTFDQRAVLAGFIPLAALLVRLPDRRLLAACAAALAAGGALPVLCAAAYLTYYGLWGLFIEQTIEFPSRYRVGSQSLREILQAGLRLHRFLFLLTPIMAVTALAGLCALVREAQRRPAAGASLRSLQSRLLLLCAIPLAAIPLFGARDFDYYTVTWLPYLALLSAFSVYYFGGLPLLVRRTYVGALWMPVLLALLSALTHADWRTKEAYRGDGTPELISFLQQELRPEESLYVWGYRPDIYIRLGRLAAYPAMNHMMIQPDSSIRGSEERRRHVFPKYEAELLRLLEERPPDLILTFDEERQPESRANTAVVELVRTRYKRIYESERTDFRGKQVQFRLYRRSSPL